MFCMIVLQVYTKVGHPPFHNAYSWCHSPPVQLFYGDEEATAESSYRCDDRREAEGLRRKGTDQSNEECYPGLVEGDIGQDDLQVD